MTNHNYNDIVDRLNAMRVQGETMKCANYFKWASHELNESCRRAMVTWIRQLQKTLNLSPESVWIGMSYFDRYLSSGRGNSKKALKSKRKFQLAAITAFYTAVKIYEPFVLDLDKLTRICRGLYTKSDITAMESDILAALDWRVSCHTPMDLARHLLDLLSEELPPYVADALLEGCQKTVDCAVFDIYFSSVSPSVLGASCLITSLRNSNILVLSKKKDCWFQPSELCDFGGIAAQYLKSFASSQKPRIVRKLNGISKSDVTAPSSPVSVTKAVRQA